MQVPRRTPAGANPGWRYTHPVPQCWEDQVLDFQDSAYRESYIIDSAPLGDALEGLSDVIRDSVDSVLAWCLARVTKVPLNEIASLSRLRRDEPGIAIMSSGTDEAPGMLISELLDESTIAWLERHSQDELPS